MSDVKSVGVEPSTPAVRPEVRPKIVGPDDGLEVPFPICLEGEVVRGFGRGSGNLVLHPRPGTQTDKQVNWAYRRPISLRRPYPNCSSMQNLVFIMALRR